MTVLTHSAAHPASHAPSSSHHSHELLGGVLPLLIVAAMVWALEQRRRGQEDGALRAPSLAACVRASLRLAPELAGLALCGVVVGAVLLRGENHGAVPASDEDKELWSEIRSQWPALSTADSLLGLAAILRVFLLVSSELRRKEAAATPFMAEPVVFMFLAAAARSTMLVLSPQDVYHLDGPLGGYPNIVLEVLAALLLAHLAARALRSGAASVTAVAAGALLLLPVALCNRLAIADTSDSHLDALFSLAQLLDLGAAVAFLVRTMAAAGGQGDGGGAFATLAFFMLPLLQLLPAYFLMTAWGKPPLTEVPELVGAGRPFEVLQLAGLAQVGLYVLSWAMRIAFTLEEKAAEAYIAI